MPKLTIYVDKRLAEEVRAAKLGVSWVCQRALKEEVRKMNARKQATNEIESVAARLRETIDEDARTEYDTGYEVGADWARRHATYAELREVAAMRDQNWIWWDLPEGHSLTWFLDMREDVDWSDPHGRGGRLEPGPLADGLIAGASAVLDAAEPHVRRNDA